MRLNFCHITKRSVVRQKFRMSSKHKQVFVHKYFSKHSNLIIKPGNLLTRLLFKRLAFELTRHRNH